MDSKDKERLKQFLDEDGKIIITDDMPDDLKQAINYMNENNINLLEKRQHVSFDDEDTDEIDDSDDESFDLSSEVEFEDEDAEEVENDNISDEADESSLQDLDNLF